MTPTKRRAPLDLELVAFALDGDTIAGGLDVVLLPGDSTPTVDTAWADALALDDTDWPWGALVGPPYAVNGQTAPPELQHAGLGVYTLWRRFTAAPEVPCAPVCTVHIVAKP